MKRREFVVVAGGAAGARPVTAWAQRPTELPLVAAIFIGSNTFGQSGGTDFLLRENLRALGYIDNKTMRYIARRVDGSADEMSKAVTDLVALSPRVIYANGDQLARAMAAATVTIPIVAQTDGHVAAGLSDSLARPSRNVTGTSRQEAELDVKRLELLHEVSPAAGRILVLRDPETGGALRMSALGQAAAQLKLRLDVRDIVTIADVAGAIAAGKAGGAEAILVSGSPLLSSPAVPQIKAAAVMHRLPFIVAQIRSVTQLGALISYGVNEPLLVARMAYMIDRILNGAKPADIPIEQPTHFLLGVNLKTAGEIGLTILPSILARADEVIE